MRLAVMMYVRFPLSLRNVEDLLHERGIDISHETVRFWPNRFGPLFAAEIRKKSVSLMRAYSNWQLQRGPSLRLFPLARQKRFCLTGIRARDFIDAVGILSNTKHARPGPVLIRC
jgi:hypothetical protein